MLSFTVVSGIEHYHTEKKHAANTTAVMLVFTVQKLKSSLSHPEYGCVLKVYGS